MRGQISTIDLVLAVIVFSILFVFFVSSWSSTVASAKNAMKKNRMEYSAISATDLLLKSAGSSQIDSGGTVIDFADDFSVDDLANWTATTAEWRINSGGSGVAERYTNWPATMIYRGNASDDNYTILVKFNVPESGSRTGIAMHVGDGSHWYECGYSSSGENRVIIYYNTGAGESAHYGNYTDYVATPGSWYYVKANASGTTKQCKVWGENETEPAIWQATLVDAGRTSGMWGMYSRGGVVSFDDFKKGHQTAPSGNTTTTAGGFASSPYVLSADKIAQFTALNYSTQKDLLGMNEEFYFYVDVNGTRYYEGGNLTAAPKSVVSIVRYGTLNGDAAIIGMMVYG